MRLPLYRPPRPWTREPIAGLTAVGGAIPDPDDALRAAVSLAVPTVRYSRELLPAWTAALTEAAPATRSPGP